MIDKIREAWSWIGLDPKEVIAANPFGNVIVRATDGAFWRICPEELSCMQIASNEDEFAALSNQEEFRTDWEMSRLVELARQTVGSLTEGRCYCLKLPAVIGGKYESENLGTITQLELIGFSGDLAEQIKDLPDGSKIELKVVD